MAAPNIVGVTTIVGLTTFVNLPSTNATTIVSNAANSSRVLKINTIIVGNVSAATTANITVSIHNAAAGAGTTSIRLANAIDVVPKSTLVALDKASSIYLEEDRSLTVTASAANNLNVICSYEQISS